MDGAPSILFVMTDTQGANVVGAYGRPELSTPNLDNLAREGVRFQRAYTTSPLCTPARASIYSGMYASLSGPWANSLPFGEDVRTMGQRFQEQGYHTAHIGKWHLDGSDYFGLGSSPPGWDPAYWYDARNYLDELGPARSRLWRQGLLSVDDLRDHGITADFTMASRVSDRAISFLKKHGSGPFLLAVSYDEPHYPYTCPPEFVEPFVDYGYPIGPAVDDDLAHKPNVHRAWAEIYSEKVADRLTREGRWREPLYFGCNSFVDQQIGRVLAAVREHAPPETWIVFTSDHGAMLGAHQLHDKGPAMYEEIVRVPLIIARADGAGGGRVNHTPVSHIDLLPTLLDLVGLPKPPIMPGRTLVPQLEGQEDPGREVVIEFNRFMAETEFIGGLQPVRCLTGERYKLALNLFSTDELYDLSADPAECNNLIDHPDYQDVRNEMHDRLLERMDTVQDPFGGRAWALRPWRKDIQASWVRGERARLGDGYRPEPRRYLTGAPFPEPES